MTTFNALQLCAGRIEIIS